MQKKIISSHKKKPPKELNKSLLIKRDFK